MDLSPTHNKNRHCAPTHCSPRNTRLQEDALLQAMGFTREFTEVQAHGNTKLHVIHTNDLHKAATTIE